MGFHPCGLCFLDGCGQSERMPGDGEPPFGPGPGWSLSFVFRHGCRACDGGGSADQSSGSWQLGKAALCLLGLMQEMVSDTAQKHAPVLERGVSGQVAKEALQVIPAALSGGSAGVLDQFQLFRQPGCGSVWFLSGRGNECGDDAVHSHPVRRGDGLIRGTQMGGLKHRGPECGQFCVWVDGVCRSRGLDGRPGCPDRGWWGGGFLAEFGPELFPEFRCADALQVGKDRFRIFEQMPGMHFPDESDVGLNEER